jgi:hypothetical protein
MLQAVEAVDVDMEAAGIRAGPLLQALSITKATRLSQRIQPVERWGLAFVTSIIRD